MPRTATQRDYCFPADVADCHSNVAFCVHPAGLAGGEWAISGKSDRDFIVRPDGHRQGNACSCLALLPHGLGDVLGGALDDGPMSADEPVASESRPTRKGEGTWDVALDASELVLRIDDLSIALTRTQFSIISYLIQNSGRWVTTAELISEVLGTHHQPDTSLVRVHVHAIRRRLGARAPWLESDRRRARGYRWRQFEVECESPEQESS